MRTSFRIRRNLRQVVLFGIFTLWCVVSLSYWNNTHVSTRKPLSPLELFRRRVVVPQRNFQETEFPALDSKRGQFSVIDAYLNQTKHGFFLEIGNDVNETGSLTYILEKSRDWTGLQIVPDRDVYTNVLNMNRRTHLLQACLKLGDMEWPHNGAPETPCISPDVITKLTDTNTIDLLVLDLEGREMSFLHSFPLHNISVAMVAIEVHGPSAPNVRITEMNKLNFECLNIMVNRLYNRTDMIFRNRNVKREP